VFSFTQVSLPYKCVGTANILQNFNRVSLHVLLKSKAAEILYKYRHISYNKLPLQFLLTRLHARRLVSPTRYAQRILATAKCTKLHLSAFLFLYT
jgi:hypothetical protein